MVGGGGARGPAAGPLVLTLPCPVPPGKLLEPHKYAALQKLDDPNEICAYEAIPSPQVLQPEHVREVAVPSGSQKSFGYCGVSPRAPTGSLRPAPPAFQIKKHQVWDVALTPVTLSGPLPRPRPAPGC